MSHIDMVRRIQLIKYRDSIAGAERGQFEEALKCMPHRIPTVTDWSIGQNINPMYPGDRPYNLVWQTEFRDIRGLQVFNTHPYHREFVWPYLNPDDPKCVVEYHFTVVY